MTKSLLFALALSWLVTLAHPAAAQTPAPFAKGADISWITQMEQANYLFYNEMGVQKELFQLLHDYDMSATQPCRPRFTASPGSWCGWWSRPGGWPGGLMRWPWAARPPVSTS